MVRTTRYRVPGPKIQKIASSENMSLDTEGQKYRGFCGFPGHRIFKKLSLGV